MISCINLLGILGDEAADFKGLAGKRSRMWEGTLATERGVWDRANALPRKNNSFSFEISYFGVF